MLFTIGLETLLVKKYLLIFFFFSENYGNIKIDSYGSLPLKKKR